jgi:hypothetical protein
VRQVKVFHFRNGNEIGRVSEIDHKHAPARCVPYVIWTQIIPRAMPDRVWLRDPRTANNP